MMTAFILQGASVESDAGGPLSLIAQDPHTFPGGGVPPFRPPPPPVGPGALVPPPLMGQVSPSTFLVRVGARSLSTWLISVGRGLLGDDRMV